MTIDTRRQEADPLVHFIALRTNTDYSIPPSLILAAVVSWILWTFYSTELLFKTISRITSLSPSIALGAIGLPAFVATIPVAYIVYSVVNRRNEHFRRSEGFLWAAIGRLKNSTNSTDTTRMFAINTAERDLWGTAVNEKERSAYLWSLLTLVPYVGGFFLAYALYRVTNDFQKHEEREFATIEDIQRAVGMPVGPLPAQTRRWFPSRNSAAYFAASLATAGLFSIYWLYVAMRDPAAHFQVQSHLENEVQPIVSGLHSMSPSRPAAGAM